jgi:hypothetical protein
MLGDLVCQFGRRYFQEEEQMVVKSRQDQGNRACEGTAELMSEEERGGSPESE